MLDGQLLPTIKYIVVTHRLVALFMFQFNAFYGTDNESIAACSWGARCHGINSVCVLDRQYTNVKRTTHFHLVPTSGMRRAVPRLSHITVMPST